MGKQIAHVPVSPFYVEDLILEMWCYGASKKFMFDSWLSFLIVEGKESNTVCSSRCLNKKGSLVIVVVSKYIFFIPSTHLNDNHKLWKFKFGFFLQFCQTSPMYFRYL